jgi:hypothetical protein
MLVSHYLRMTDNEEQRTRTVWQRGVGLCSRRCVKEIAACCYVLVYVIALALVIDWAQSQPHSRAMASQVDLPAQTSSKASEWDKERMRLQYDTAVREIRKRIEFQNTLYLARYGLCGTLLTFILSSSLREVIARWLGLGRGAMPFPSGVLPRPTAPRGLRARFDGAYVVAGLWLATLVSTILDAQLAFNDSIIVQLGRWVRYSFEVFGGAIDGWETRFGHVCARAWKHARWSAYLMTALLLSMSLFVTWFALRRRLLASKPLLLEVSVSMLCGAAVTGVIAYTLWIQTL